MSFLSLTQQNATAPEHRRPIGPSVNNTPPKFGFITQTFSLLEQRPLVDLAVRDVACYIAPQAALTRSKDELRDILPNSLGLLAVTVGGMYLLAQALRLPVAKLTGVSKEVLKKEFSQDTAMKEKLARLAVSFGFLFPFGAGFAAIPFFRNWLTVRRTGTTDFETLIGLENKKRHIMSQEQQDAAKKKQLQAGFGALGLGGLAGLGGLLGFSALARKKIPLAPQHEKIINSLFNNFALRGKRSYEVEGALPILLFWLIPPSVGWILGARSRNERIEYAVKGANSILWFSLFTPLIVKRYFVDRFQKYKQHGVETGLDKNGGAFRYLKASIPTYRTLQEKLPTEILPEAIKLKNKYAAASWLVPVTMLAITPQLINIYFTKKRFEKNEAHRQKHWQTFDLQNKNLPSRNPFIMTSPYHQKIWLRFNQSPVKVARPVNQPGLP